MDYSKKRNWIFCPKPEKQRHPVDVFYVYPTVYVHPNRGGHHYMNPGNPLYRMFAIVMSWWQVQPFAHSCNCFAPFYRQLGLESLKMPIDEFLAYMRPPYEEIVRAFHYYIENLNDGRPFVLAGHSQGSAILQELLRREFADGKYDDRFVAAYLPGFSMVREDFEKFPHLKLSATAEDTGAIITYNSTALGLKLMKVVRKDSVCVNPLSWDTTTDYMGKQLNAASVLFEYKKFSISKKHFTGAYVDEPSGTLMIDDDALYALMHVRIGFLNRILMNKGSLHMLDIALFHRNLQHNTALRIEKFLEKKRSGVQPEYTGRVNSTPFSTAATHGESPAEILNPSQKSP